MGVEEFLSQILDFKWRTRFSLVCLKLHCLKLSFGKHTECRDFPPVGVDRTVSSTGAPSSELSQISPSCMRSASRSIRKGTSLRGNQADINDRFTPRRITHSHSF
ncbi:hypothetical protein HAX54_012474 [Datura stramonium]|uniref:Uncharacterized protein n=1 Tax=Datura stramonium TaxID=4076 RepID=A0ABS8TLR0_DATST|nr:hypothetical protein [Datura stramonium]